MPVLSSVSKIIKINSHSFNVFNDNCGFHAHHSLLTAVKNVLDYIIKLKSHFYYLSVSLKRLIIT